MSFGRHTDVECPHGCGQQLGFIDYRKDPPPIPPPRNGGYAKLNHYSTDERSVLECPRCEGDLANPGAPAWD